MLFIVVSDCYLVVNKDEYISVPRPYLWKVTGCRCLPSLNPAFHLQSMQLAVIG